MVVYEANSAPMWVPFGVLAAPFSVQYSSEKQIIFLAKNAKIIFLLY